MVFTLKIYLRFGMTMKTKVSLLLSGLVFLAAANPLWAETSPSLAAALPAGAPVAGFADLTEKLVPQVVNISTTQKVSAGADLENFQDMLEGMPPLPPGSPFEEFFDQFKNQQRQRRNSMPEQKVTSLGSGFIIDPSGYIVTNNHVIQDADEINVILQDNSTLKAELVGYDKKTDLAVIKVKPEKPLPASVWGDSDKMRVGNWVLAIGNPYGLGGTVTAGIISARARDIQSGPYDDFLQTDAAINRGNSGGPMFNMAGEVIGVNSAIFSPTGGSVGIGFAIPSNLAKNIVEQLKTSGHTKRGWLGVRIQSVAPEIAESLGLGKPRGALISNVTPAGPAEKAGIKSGDVVLAFDGKEVTEMRRLPRIVAETDVGKVAPITVWRDGKTLELKVKLGELEKFEKEEAGQDETKSEKTPPTGKAETAGDELEEFGLTLGTLNAQNRQRYSVKADVKGVLITAVKAGSRAAERDLRAGDVILEIGQREVSSIADVRQAAAQAKERNRPLLLLVGRDGDARFVALPLPAKDKPKADAPKADAPVEKP
jgi:serine protease Do